MGRESEYDLNPSELLCGDRVEVTLSFERPADNPRKGIVKRKETNTGEVVAVPSKKFDGFDFDYSVEVIGEKGATRSVNLETGEVRQLMFRVGGDEEWDSFTLESVELL